MISGSLCPACRAFILNSSTSSRLNPNWIDCRFDNVRTNRPAATRWSGFMEVRVFAGDNRMHRPFCAGPGNHRRASFLWTLLLCVTWSARTLAQPRTEVGVRFAAPVRGPMIEAGTVTVAPYYHILTSAPRHVWVGA